MAPASTPSATDLARAAPSTAADEHATIQPATPAGVPVAKPAAAPRYGLSDHDSTTEPVGSRPPVVASNRAMARATTPFPARHGGRVGSSPCPTDATTSAGARDDATVAASRSTRAASASPSSAGPSPV